MREAERCPHLEPSPGPGPPGCGLVRALTGLTDPGSCRVGPDACAACCLGPVPTARRVNPVVASLLSKAAAGVVASGGQPGCTAGKAADLLRWARNRLAEAVSTPTGPSSGDGPSGAGVAVVIVCRRPGAAPADAIESALSQSPPAREVVVVDLTGGGEVGRSAGCYAGAGVRHLRVDDRGPLRALRAGFEATTAEVVCFLDADDVLVAGYLERGLPLFGNPEVGIVYSDVEYVGDRPGRTFTPAFDPVALERDPYIHAGSLARRRALRIADAFRDAPVADPGAEWVVWRRVVGAGWRAAKQPSVFRVRSRPGPGRPDPPGDGYYERASLGAAEVTLFTPLSGRARLWDDYADWLRSQTWPRGQCRLFLMDTSGDPDFGRTVRQFLAACDYPDVRYSARVVAEPGLADAPRFSRLDDVRLACARIYNRMARESVTPFTLIVEDDIIPPAGVIERLLRAFDPGTAAVSAPYRSRFHDDYIAWDDRGGNLRGGEGVEAVEGTGFGCLLLRRDALARDTFRFGDGEAPDFDRAFSRRLRRSGWVIKVDWSQDCRHRNGTGADRSPALVEPEQG